MDLTLKRFDYAETGIFGHLEETDSGKSVAVTLEHAFFAKDGPDSYEPKLAPGVYTCKRRMSPKFGYEVFQVIGVPPFQGHAVDFIELHRGNTNKDSIGCPLLGVSGNAVAIYDSKIAFDAVMKLQEGLDSWTLTVLR